MVIVSKEMVDSKKQQQEEEEEQQRQLVEDGSKEEDCQEPEEEYEEEEEDEEGECMAELVVDEKEVEPSNSREQYVSRHEFRKLQSSVIEMRMQLSQQIKMIEQIQSQLNSCIRSQRN